MSASYPTYAEYSFLSPEISEELREDAEVQVV
jgi:hypothetical protein